MEQEFEKLITAMMQDNKMFLDLAHQHLDAEGNVDFDKLEELGLMGEYKSAAKQSTQSRLKEKIFEEFLKQRGQFEDEKNKDASGIDLQSQIEKAKSTENITLADSAYSATRNDKGELIPSKYFITVGDKEYDVTGKSVDEQFQIYRQALNEEIQKMASQGMSEEQIQKMCQDVYGKKQDILKSLTADSMKL